MRRRLFSLLAFLGCTSFLFTLALMKSRRINKYPQKDRRFNAAYKSVKSHNISLVKYDEIHDKQSRPIHHAEESIQKHLRQIEDNLTLSSTTKTAHFDSTAQNKDNFVHFKSEQNYSSTAHTINFQTRRRNGELMKKLEQFKAWKMDHAKLLRNRSTQLRMPPPTHVNNSYIWNQMLTKFPLVFRRLMKPFLPDYKNPCFHQNDGSLRCLPYFILVGAGKCGSTDLYYHITRHPRIVRIYKENHFWTHMQKTDTSISQYLDSLHKFTDTVKTNQDKESMIFGDGSPSYIWENNNLPKNRRELIFLWADMMHAVMPGAKIIMILRNPTNRTISHYFYSGKNQSPADFHRRTIAETNKFKQCLQQHRLRECATKMYQPKIQISLYIAHVREWLRVYPRDQVLILRTEDWHNHSNNNIFQRIFKFLEIEELSEAELPAIDEGRILAEMESKKATEKKSQSLGYVLPETRKILDDFFEPYNKELAGLLGDDAFFWKD